MTAKAAAARDRRAEIGPGGRNERPEILHDKSDVGIAKA
jgi:hypothetical protein